MFLNKDNQGSSYEDHIEQAKASGIDPEALDSFMAELVGDDDDIEEEPPTELEYLWEVFLDLSKTRGGGFGPAPITYLELQAYTEMTQVTLTYWEIDVIKLLDITWLLEYKKANSKNSSKD